jgi:lipoic acid synthetase
MSYEPKPGWLKRQLPETEVLIRMKGLLRSLKLHTVCENARCPNQGECFGRGVATFMILGNICTRNCRFCSIEHEKPLEVDENEPEHVAEAVKALNLKYVVITSVTRDDLPDGGAFQFARTAEAIHALDPQIIVETLIPDLNGSLDGLKSVIDSRPGVLSHNLETVPRLYGAVRPQADYRRSLGVLENAKKLKDAILTKSGLMLGLGEEKGAVLDVLRDLKGVECDFVTLGQYLQPTLRHHPVVSYVSPEEFEEYRWLGIEMGFKSVASAPLVRSSYFADEMFRVGK